MFSEVCNHGNRVQSGSDWWLIVGLFRYPVILEQFSLRPSSGGAGKYFGGDGVIRKLLFRDEVVLSVLTERRSTRPYGLQGKPRPRLLHRHVHAP